MKLEKQTDNGRNSSIELFRIIAMLLVLIVHLNGWLVGGLPKNFDFDNVTFYRVGQMIIHSFSIICVNCFIIISGFYGLKLKWKSLWKMYTLLLSIYIPLYIAGCIYHDDFSLIGFLDNILAFSRESYFIQCYLMLMFLSPFINLFIDKYGKQILIYVLVFVFIEFWFDCIRNNMSLGFNHGFSLLHFIVIYLLGRVCFLYKEEIANIKRIYCFLGYILCSIFLCLMYMVGIKFVWYYSNPLVIMSSFCLFFFFCNKKYSSSSINMIAQSALTIYLFHTYGVVLGFITKIDLYILENYTYSVYLISILLIICSILVICILYDWIRKKTIERLFDKIWNYLDKKLKRNFFIQ